MSENDRQEERPSATAVLEPPKKRPTASATKPRKLPPYHVVLLNDDDHTYDYVIEMLKAIFGHSEERGRKLAKEVDDTGRVIVLTTSKEHAEFKRDQIHAFGKDKRIASCQGSMSAIIEPAEDA